MRNKCLSTAFALLIAFVANSQLKIGDNPSTINANSLLEMESSNKGFLAPRVVLNDKNSVSPLTGTVPAGMIVYSSGGAVTDGFYFWNGTQWMEVLTDALVRDRYVLVKSAADLPAPVDGVITLTAGTLYEINGTIVLTSKINLNGCYLIGQDANNDKLVYTPSSGEMFTGTKGGTIKALTMVANTTGSKLFNLDLPATENLIVRDAIIASCKDIGLVKGGYIVFFSVINYSGNTSGITYQDVTNLFLDNTAWFPTNANTYEKLTGTFGVIAKQGGFSQPMSGSAGVALDISGITSITEAGNLKNTAFLGTGTMVNGSFSGKWEVEAAGLSTEKDDVATGNLYLTGSASTTFTATSTPTKVLGTTTATGLFRVSATGNNRLTYTGVKTRRFAVIASLSVVAAAANKYYSFYVFKNGVMLPESEQAMRLSSGVDKGSLTLSCTVLLAPNDYIEIWAANTSDASAMTVETLNVAIK